MLRDGPGVGVYVLAWCDSWNNLTRLMDRQALREFEQRVALQMSATDSSNLLDSPLAGRLGMHRGLYIGPELSQPEKFRPYQPPEPAWLAEVAERFR